MAEAKENQPPELSESTLHGRTSKGTSTRSGQTYVLLQHPSHRPQFALPQSTDIRDAASASGPDGVLSLENADYTGNYSDFDDDSEVSVGRKRSRDGENEDVTSDESQSLTVQRRRSKCCRTTNTSEGHNSSDEFLATLVSSKPKVNGSTKPKTVIRKKLKPRRKLQTKPSSVTAINDVRLFIRPLGQTHTFTFQNKSCTHSSPVVLNQGTPSTPTDLPDSHSTAPDDDFDTSCIALKAFNMSFFRPLGMVFCQIHKVCVPLCSLKSHITAAIRRRHTGTLAGAGGKNLIGPFLSHIASTFHLPLDQTFSSQGPETKQLSKAIPYMEAPRIYLQCSSCKIWLYQSGKGGWESPAVKRHLTESESNTQCAKLLLIPESEKPVLKECYGQRPCGTRGVGNEATIPFIEILGWSPETAPTVPHSPQQPTCPPNPQLDLSQQYVTACKWNTYFPTSLAEVLHELCLLPNSSFFTGDDEGDDDDTENQNNDAETLERGLYEVQIFLRRYLENANAFVNSCEIGFRTTLTHGYVQGLHFASSWLTFYSTNSEFRDLSDGSYQHYYYPLLHSVAFLLRLRFRCDRGDCLPDNFKVPFTQSLRTSRNELYKFLMSAPLEKDIDLITLGVLVHGVLVSMLTAQCKVIDRIGHIFDITVPMALYNGDGTYRSASCATKYCAQMQYCLRSVVVHIVRLGGPSDPFTFFEIPATAILSNEDFTVTDHSEESLDLEELEVVDDLYPLRRENKFAKPPVKEPLHLIDEDDDDAIASPTEGHRDQLLV